MQQANMNASSQLGAKADPPYPQSQPTAVLAVGGDLDFIHSKTLEQRDLLNTYVERLATVCERIGAKHPQDSSPTAAPTDAASREGMIPAIIMQQTMLDRALQSLAYTTARLETL